MAMTKGDYFALGVADHATERCGDAMVRMFELDNRSWQAKAYWAGWEAPAPTTGRTSEASPVLQNFPLRTAEAKMVMGGLRAQRRSPGKSVVPEMSLPLVMSITQWPEGAQSHFFCVKRDYHSCADVKRKARLYKSLLRLTARWSQEPLVGT